MSSGPNNSPPAALQKAAGHGPSASLSVGKDKAVRPGDPTIAAQIVGQQPPAIDPADPALLEPATGRRRGVVKFFDTQKGFGFINDYRPEELNNEEVFVHYTSIAGKSGFRSLAEGEEAEYDIVRGGKGFSAATVTGPGGQPVLGDNRNRAVRNNFVQQMSPFASLYPYIQQEAASFYQPSPYNQPQILVQGDFHHYRNPGSYAGVGPPVFAPANAPYGTPPMQSLSPIASFGLPPFSPSPFSSPAAYKTPLDLPRDYAAAFAGVTLEDDLRNKNTFNQTPFGGMFGPLPGYDTGTHVPSHTTSGGPAAEASAISATPARSNPIQAGHRSVVPPQGSHRSGSFDSLDRMQALSMSSGPLSAGAVLPGHPASIRATASSAAPARPQPTQSSSSSAMYAPAPAGKALNEW